LPASIRWIFNKEQLQEAKLILSPAFSGQRYQENSDKHLLTSNLCSILLNTGN